MDFQVVTWESCDQNDEFVIQMFGRTKDHKSVYCETAFTPYFFLEVPNHFQDYHVRNYLEEKRLLKDLTNVRMVNRKRFFGFTNNKEFHFACLVFANKAAWKRAYFTIRKDPKYSRKIYEANIDPILRFIHLTKIQSTGWVHVSQFTRTDAPKTTCDVEIVANHWKHVSPLEDDSIAPLVIASYDIETYSPDRSFPDPESRDNDCPVIQIATTFQTYGSSEYTRTLLTLKECSPIEGVTTECFDNERDLLLRWAALISEKDPDIITGYNIWKFDNQYVYKRAVRNHADHLFNLNRLTDMTTTIYKAKFSSSAYGDNEYDMITTSGRMQIDLLEMYKRDHKLVKYTLNFVSEHFLGDKKVYMPIHEMFSRYDRGTPEDIQAIGEYCVKDTVLPLRLMQKLSNIPNLVEMARATYVPMNYLLERGQQIKVFSQICKQTQMENMLVPTIQDGKTNESFVGATVLEAKKGAYMDRVITGLDFASLYPTIMRAHNLCYNTIVLDPSYKDLPGVEYETISWDVNGKQNEYTFAQTTQGVLPKLLEQLAKSRKKAKKDMANAKDPFMKDVYNGKQLAFKVSMNSIYGFCSAFMLPCQPISACVTTIGRNMIEHTKNLVEEWYPGSEVVYGDTDSVMVHFNTKEMERKLGKSALEISFMFGHEAADRITKTFKQPIELEMEKCYSPYLLFSKKRYAGLMYTKPEAPDYIDAKGIQLVRRDNAPFVKDISKTVLNMIMYKRDIFGSVDLVQEKARELLEGKIPVEQLIVSKSMRKDYSNDKQPHLAVALKMEERNPGSGPKCGERVPYLIMEPTNHKVKQLLHERAEDPNYVIEQGLQDKVDRLYYLEHGLVSPLEAFFDLFIEGSKNAIFGDIIKEYQNKRVGKQNGNVITSFFKQSSNATEEKKPPKTKKELVQKSTQPKKNTQRSITLFM